MPKVVAFPIPKKRYHGGRWRIIWKWKNTQYSIPTPYLDPKKSALVDTDLRQISGALTKEPPEFPRSYRDCPSAFGGYCSQFHEF